MSQKCNDPGGDCSTLFLVGGVDPTYPTNLTGRGCDRSSGFHFISTQHLEGKNAFEQKNHPPEKELHLLNCHLKLL